LIGLHTSPLPLPPGAGGYFDRFDR
jgi:hypothetical protein